jgi:outer membrane protein OmpA-like peptidoglycan-associated protein
MKEQQLLNSERSSGESATDSAEKKCIALPAPAAEAVKVHSQEAQGEDSKDKVVRIFKPSQNDVLFGRGKVSILHSSMKTTVLAFLFH